jgi:hypothetical protein
VIERAQAASIPAPLPALDTTFSRRLADIGALLMISVSFVVAWSFVRGTTWPPEMDHYRDLAAAQWLLHGHFAGDVAFAGEARWYPPLVPALGAALAAVLRIPLPRIWAEMGPFVNLLAPITFYLLARLLMSPLAAFSALAGFLFFGLRAAQLGFQATYSPWVWPNQFVQCFFYGAAACWLMSIRTGSRRWEVATGILLGVTFLGHPVPATVLGLALALDTSLALRRGTPPAQRRVALRRLLICAGVSTLFAVPVMAPLVIRYHLRVQNDTPTRTNFLGLHAMFKMIATPRAALASLGLWAVLRPSNRWLGGNERRVVLAMGAASIALTGYGVIVALADKHGLPRLPLPVPMFHAHFYAKAVESLLFGVGVVFVVDAAARKVSFGGLTLTAMSTILLAVMLSFKGYLRRSDVVRWPAESRRLAADPVRGLVYDWALQLPANAVVLAPWDLSLFAVLPAGHHVVALEPMEASPYVPAKLRAEDAREMYRALAQRDFRAFEDLAKRYAVTDVVAVRGSDGDVCFPPAADGCSQRLRLTMETPTIRVYHLGAAPLRPAAGG